ncbi:hypothetical protein, partial [Mesorhizobium sp. M2D.F.Ca.ET.153.01.1.1]|uniref:hypothetical protein n=1 Tax=Mesorhizobium sp. M2D.F.Ca.ET.153.01.1.1 TaxID=2500520 RepID=UPI001AEDB115
DLRQHLRQELEAVLDKTGIPLLLISHDPQDVAMFASVQAGREKNSTASAPRLTQAPPTSSWRGTVTPPVKSVGGCFRSSPPHQRVGITPWPATSHGR